MLILIAAASAGIAYFVASHVFGTTTKSKNVTVKTIEAITSDVQSPDPKIFNENAINPSIEVNIGNSGTATTEDSNATTTTTTSTSTDASGTDATTGN